MTILDDILAHKRVELKRAKEVVSAPTMAARAGQQSEPTRGFRRTLEAAASPAVIAEVKRRSPSRGEIRPDFDPLACATSYARGGAAGLSILTDERFFGGRLETLARVREKISLPLLRKDFVVDPYQIDEARCAGADAVLLIVAALAEPDLVGLLRRAEELALDALVEVHDERELDLALAVGASWLGINNRDLRSFEVDLGVTERLAGRVAGREDVLLVAESGIHGPEDIERLTRVGAKAFLVGESLMREPDVEGALRRLRRSE